MAPKSVCQVEVADNYDHKHQPVSEDDAAKGLSRMSVDICQGAVPQAGRRWHRVLRRDLSQPQGHLYRCALDLLEAYSADARQNGLSLDRHREEKMIELFAQNIMTAGQVFLDNPAEQPFIPNWSRVHAADPGLTSDMLKAVAEDQAEFT